MVFSFPCSLICFLSIISLFPSISTSIDIKLSHFQTEESPSSNPYQRVNHLVSTSLTRAHHLKNPKHGPSKETSPSTIKAPLFSQSYGAFSMPLSFGTPPQTLSFVMDTGSSFVWFPCTTHYICKDCSFGNSSPASGIPSFIPRRSSSARIVGCENPKCSWIHPGASRQCRDPEGICSPYFILYGSGSTGGLALSETLHLDRGPSVPNFLVGCSVESSRQPAGIAGFGRGPSSLPSQLNLTKFSYCSLSYQTIKNPSVQSWVILDQSHTRSEKKTDALIYTPLVKNPVVQGKSAFLVYYYVGLRRISMGGKRVKIPYKYLSASDRDGNGGTMVDSGTTFTFMSRGAFVPLSNELVAQMERKRYKRDSEAEKSSGLKPCFDVSRNRKALFPELKLHFKGGAELVLPVENYMAFVGDDHRAACLTVVTDAADREEAEEGPGIILGNFQLQNFYVEFDNFFSSSALSATVNSADSSLMCNLEITQQRTRSLCVFNLCFC